MDMPSTVTQLLKHAIEEDIGYGDITTSLLIPEESESRALYVAKANFVVAGFPLPGKSSIYWILILYLIPTLLKAQKSEKAISLEKFQARQRHCLPASG